MSWAEESRCGPFSQAQVLSLQRGFSGLTFKSKVTYPAFPLSMIGNRTMANSGLLSTFYTWNFTETQPHPLSYVFSVFVFVLQYHSEGRVLAEAIWPVKPFTDRALCRKNSLTPVLSCHPICFLYVIYHTLIVIII